MIAFNYKKSFFMINTSSDLYLNTYESNKCYPLFGKISYLQPTYMSTGNVFLYW